MTTTLTNQLLTAFGDGVFNDGYTPEREGRENSLLERFLIPPFTIFDARQGYWQQRKGEWITAGLRGELGRPGQITFSKSAQPPSVYHEKNVLEARLGHAMTWDEYLAVGTAAAQPGTSIFDPVLCEVAYRCFCPPRGNVLDPFAGGSVRGVVAGALGYSYTGVDLRADQVEANRQQSSELAPKFAGYAAPTWIIGDSQNIDVLAGGQYDFIFSCPPYADLEVYSDDPADLSTMDYQEFVVAYRSIIAKSVAMLEADRFACFVVGDVRDKKGFCRPLLSDTIKAFEDAGAGLYNHAILITATSSAAIRAGSAFTASHKLTRHHQYVLVFCKGDFKKATEACGVPEFGELENYAAGEDYTNYVDGISE